MMVRGALLFAQVTLLAIRDDREAADRFGDAHTRWRAEVPGWFPRLRRTSTQHVTRP
jgi:protein-S-isoprenylcysteine O-methyltransferase Ste14